MKRHRAKGKCIVNIPCLILQFISGIAASNLVAGAIRNCGLGTLGNSLAGILGGGLGGQIFLSLTGVESDFHSSDAQIFLASVFGGASGGAFVTAVAGMVRRLLSRNS
jgi:hypothetical protein